MDHEGLVDALAAWASGSSGAEAAVELLVETDIWLCRPDFMDVAVIEDDRGRPGIDWLAAHDFSARARCSRGERLVLRLCCAMADPEILVSLGDLGGLDLTNLRMVQQALHTARFGWQE